MMRVCGTTSFAEPQQSHLDTATERAPEDQWHYILLTDGMNTDDFQNNTTGISIIMYGIRR